MSFAVFPYDTDSDINFFADEIKQIEGKTFPVQARRDAEGSRNFSLPYFMTIGT